MLSHKKQMIKVSLPSDVADADVDVDGDAQQLGNKQRKKDLRQREP